MTTHAATPSPQKTAADASGSARSAVILFAKVALLFFSAAATALALALAPEDNNYGEASRLKHARLAALASPKLVLIGGSNLAYGVDSVLLEQLTGCETVNMGMNGYFGVRLMLNEVRGDLRAGDIAVMAFEHDNYFKSVEGAASSVFVVSKLNPSLFQSLSPRQWREVVFAVPEIAQMKVLRYIREGIAAGRDAAFGGRANAAVDITQIESLSGFTPEGDLVSHLGVTWPYDLEQGTVPAGAPVETEALSLMRVFNADMAARGVRVMISYTSVLEDYYRSRSAELEAVHALVQASPPLLAPSPPSDYTFKRSEMFDTVYHLNADGRRRRTEMLAADLRRAFGPGPICGASTGGPRPGPNGAPG